MKNKDWSGDGNSVFKTLAASNHSKQERGEYDYYATDPIAAEILLKEESFSKDIWECACGEKHLSKVFEQHGYRVRSSDLIDRCGNEVCNFLTINEKWGGDIITNPPYKYAREFVCKALSLVDEGQKVAMFLKLLFLEGKGRREIFTKYPPRTVYVFSGRVVCAKNGDFEELKRLGSAVAYAWFIWEKGYKGDTIVRWIN